MSRIKNVFVLFGLLLMCLSINAQDRGDQRKEQREKVERLKIAYMTERLDLTTAEAQLFWPIYNEKESTVESIRKEMKPFHKKLKNEEVNSDEEFLELISKGVEGKVREAEAIEEFLKKSLPVLGRERTLILINIEKDFRKRMKEKMEGG